MKKTLYRLVLVTLITLVNANLSFANVEVRLSDDPDKTEYKFIYDEKPLQDSFIIENVSDEPVEVLIYGVDSLSSKTGTLGYKTYDQRQKNIGKWLTVDPHVQALAPHEKKTIFFTINPEERAQAGTYLGGISIETLVAQKDVNKTTPIASISVKVSIRTVHKIIASIPGTVINKYKETFFKYKENPNNIEVTYGILNEGNSLLTVDGEINAYNNGTLIKSFAVTKTQINSQESTNNTYYFTKPYYGNVVITSKFQIFAYNAVEDNYSLLDEKTHQINLTIIPWDSIKLVSGILVLLIALLIIAISIHKIRHDAFIKSCEKYTVKTNDTVESVAENFKMDWKLLVKINKLKAPYSLTVDKQILIKKP